MRLQNYLNEKYMTTMHQKFRGGDDFEVFIGPSKKELREIVDMDGGFRFVIDFKNQKFYAFSMRMFHETFFKRMPPSTGLPDWHHYWVNGEGLDYIYTGASAGGDRGYESDAMIRFGAETYKYGKSLEKLAAQDWRWVGKFVDMNKVKKTVTDNLGKPVMTASRFFGKKE